MASVKINIANKIGDMTVMTFSVAVREQFVTMVLRGEEVWNMLETVNVEDARMVHERFLIMCSVFNPVSERVAQEQEAGIPQNRDALIQELDNGYKMVQASRKGMLH